MISLCIDKIFSVFSLGDNSIMGERRHKDEIDSADDSDGKEDDLSQVQVHTISQ